jgi:hypothetical protein
MFMTESLGSNGCLLFGSIMGRLARVFLTGKELVVIRLILADPN